MKLEVEKYGSVLFAKKSRLVGFDDVIQRSFCQMKARMLPNFQMLQIFEAIPKLAKILGNFFAIKFANLCHQWLKRASYGAKTNNSGF